MPKKRKTISETKEMIAALRGNLQKHQNMVKETTLMPDKMNMAINVQSSFFLKQLITVVAASAYAFIFTYIMLALINLVVKVRVTEADEKAGLDYSLHGEKAYDEGSL